MPVSCARVTGDHQHAAGNGRRPAFPANRREKMAAGRSRGDPDRRVRHGVRAGRAGGAGRVSERPGPGYVRVLAGLGRGAGTRRLAGRPAAARRPGRHRADAPGGRHPAGAGGGGRARPEPDVVRGVRPAAGGCRGGRLRLLPPIRRGLGGRLRPVNSRRGRARPGGGGHHRAGVADAAGSVGLGSRGRAAPSLAGCRPARGLHSARPRRVGRDRRQHGGIPDRGDRRGRARRDDGSDPAVDRAGTRHRLRPYRAAPVRGRSGQRGRSAAVPGRPAAHRSHPDGGAVAVRTPHGDAARRRHAPPAAGTQRSCWGPRCWWAPASPYRYCLPAPGPSLPPHRRAGQGGGRGIRRSQEYPGTQEHQRSQPATRRWPRISPGPCFRRCRKARGREGAPCGTS
jgi:hypothetical protein